MITVSFSLCQFQLGQGWQRRS